MNKLKNNGVALDEPMKIFEKTGLIFVGVNQDGEPEWIGTINAWNKFDKLTSNF